MDRQNDGWDLANISAARTHTTMGKKPAWVIEKERAHKAETVWLFGIHAVREALANPNRNKLRLVVTKNALDRLGPAPSDAGVEPELTEPRNFRVPLDKGSVHQGAALEVRPLDWGGFDAVSLATGNAPRLILLDRVSDPHNVGAVLRSAEVFGARAVIGTLRHAAPETGALAKAASGALERQPYLRVRNLGRAIRELTNSGWQVIGLDGQADLGLADTLSGATGPLALVLGAEGTGLRAKTRELCSSLARISASGEFGSLNVSNAAAIALYQSRHPFPRRE